MKHTYIVIRGLTSPVQDLRWESTDCLTIGRQDGQHIVLNDPALAERHAEIIAEDRGWVLRSPGTASCTRLNGVRVESGEERLLSLNDVIQAGPLNLKVVLLEDGSVPPLQIENGYVNVQATAHRSWEKALDALAALEERHPGRDKHMLALLRAGHHLCHISSLNELCRTILEDAVAVLSAQRGAIVLPGAAPGEFHTGAVAFARRGKGSGVYFSKTLVQRSLDQSESLLCADVNAHTDFQTVHSIRRGGMASIICALVRSPRGRLGVLHLDRGLLQPAFTAEDLALADAIAAHVAVGIEVAQLLERQQALLVQLVEAMAQAVELRDRYTGGHTQRVTTFATRLAQELGLSPEKQKRIAIGTALHDIGKIGVRDAVLNKAGRLTDTEFEHVKAHTVDGVAILQNITEMAPVLPIIRHHHERWDGSGYPDGLAGKRIPLVARIVAVADAFDAMTSDRPYRVAMSLDEALAELQDKAGTHFDPECVRAFLSLRPWIEEVLKQPAPITRS